MSHLYFPERTLQSVAFIEIIAINIIWISLKIILLYLSKISLKSKIDFKNILDKSDVFDFVLCIKILQFGCLISKLNAKRTINLRSAGGHVNEILDSFFIKAATIVADK